MPWNSTFGDSRRRRRAERLGHRHDAARRRSGPVRPLLLRQSTTSREDGADRYAGRSHPFELLGRLRLQRQLARNRRRHSTGERIAARERLAEGPRSGVPAGTSRQSERSSTVQPAGVSRTGNASLPARHAGRDASSRSSTARFTRRSSRCSTSSRHPANRPSSASRSGGSAMSRSSSTCRGDGDYGLSVQVSDILETGPLQGAILTLWGVPADASHDSNAKARGEKPTPGHEEVCKPSVEGLGRRRRTDTLPERRGCEGRSSRCRPAARHLRSSPACSPTPGRAQDRLCTASSRDPQIANEVTGCEQLSFNPSLALAPEITQAGAPSGYTIAAARTPERRTGRTGHAERQEGGRESARGHRGLPVGDRRPAGLLANSSSGCTRAPRPPARTGRRSGP